MRALARDYVDSRRMFSEYYLYIAGAALVVLFIPSVATRLVAYTLALLTMVAVVSEGIITAWRVRKMAAQRYPAESTRGVGFYAALRAMQIRRLRLPAPRVKRGERI